MPFFNRIKEQFAIPPHRVGELVVSAISAWVLVAWLLALPVPGASASTAFAGAQAVGPALLIFLCAFLLCAILTARLPVAPYLLLLSLLLYGTNALYTAGNQYFYLIILAVFALAVAYVVHERHPLLAPLSAMSGKAALAITVAVGIVAFTYLVGLVLCRFFSYSSPCYDFGIFAQMFYHMAETLEPLTTCERDGLLSHFAVHVSPIFYLYLPFYWLIPHPATLLVMQAVFLFSGVIPLCLIARRLSLSPAMRVVIAALYFAYPAMIGGCFYDMHENKLLLPLLLWLFYFLETRRYPLVYLFAVLVLMVKEDAPIYIAFVALYWLACKPRRRHAVALLVLAVAYFYGAVTYLEEFGRGAMFGRYQNFIGYDGTPIDLIKTALLNPAMILRESLTEDKLGFLLYMLAPLGFLPLITRKFGRLILVLPMVLINLMPDYFYQHNIGYQYTYGVAAMLFYLLVLNLPDLRGKLRPALLLFGLCATILLSAMRMPGQVFFLRRMVTYPADHAAIASTLALIPDEASVRTSTMFSPHLSRRDELYEIETVHPADYAVLDLRPYVNAKQEGYDMAYFEDRGWTLVSYTEDVIALFRAPS